MSGSQQGTPRERAAAAAMDRKAGRNARQENATSTTNHAASESEITSEQNQQLLNLAGCLLAGLAAIRIMTSYVYLLLTCPILFLYMIQVCPSEQSFDVRKELKRVLRGHHLAEDHPDKPKGFLSETLARVTAAITTEIATGLGYEVTMFNLYRVLRVVWVRVPAANKDFYWVGAFSRWTYVYTAEIPDDKTD
mmetsp:Transcript_16122/g.21080  ORF Transcript_16122/g.21080 Transcript_16122/m.21080 type:complete len:193 (-) Transcript_16122:187-765(-)